MQNQSTYIIGTARMPTMGNEQFIDLYEEQGFPVNNTEINTIVNSIKTNNEVSEKYSHFIK